MTITSGIYIGLKMINLDESLEEYVDTLEEKLEDVESELLSVTKEYSAFMSGQIDIQLKILDKFNADAKTIHDLKEQLAALEESHQFALEDVEFLEKSYDEVYNEYQDMEEFYLDIIDSYEIELAECEEMVEFQEIEIDSLIDDYNSSTDLSYSLLNTIDRVGYRNNQLEHALKSTLVENDTLNSKVAFYMDRMRRIAQFCQ